MSHAAKEGAVIYSGAFVGVLLSDCMFYCSEFCYLNLWHNFCFLLDSLVSTQLGCHVKHLSPFKFQLSFPFSFLSLSCPLPSNFPFLFLCSLLLPLSLFVYFFPPGILFSSVFPFFFSNFNWSICKREHPQNWRRKTNKLKTKLFCSSLWVLLLWIVNI